MPGFLNYLRRLARAAVNFFPMQPKVAVHVENVTRDWQTRCAQLEGAVRQMGGLIPPPAHLQIRIGGAYYPHFIEHGESLLNDLDAALIAHGKKLTSFERILDFGCGCSRVLRALYYRRGTNQKLFGADIDAEAIEWCKANYGVVADFRLNKPDPPLDYAPDSFDLVISVSIFTHLPEDMQHLWLQELRRVTEPGGYLLLTTCGEKYFENVPEAERKAALTAGFHFRRAGDTPGLPDFYQTAYHTPSYIRSHWSRYFEVLDIRERALDGHQDIVVCRKG